MVTAGCAIPTLVFDSGRPDREDPPEDTAPRLDAGMDARFDRSDDAAMDDARPVRDVPVVGVDRANLDALSPCPAGQTLCGTACVDTQTHSSHCGACGMVCTPSDAGAVSCVAGACVRTCLPTQRCGGECGINSGCSVLFLETPAWRTLSASAAECNFGTYQINDTYSPFRCGHAAHEYCVSQGYSSGWGPISASATAATVICAVAGFYSEMVNLSILAAENAGCTAGAIGNLPCANAADRYCRLPAVGRASGWGVARWEPGTQRAGVLCQPTWSSVPAMVSQATIQALPSPLNQCNAGTFNGARSPNCMAAAHQLCRTMDFATGLGPIGGSMAAGWNLLCLRARP